MPDLAEQIRGFIDTGITPVTAQEVVEAHRSSPSPAMGRDRFRRPRRMNTYAIAAVAMATAICVLVVVLVFGLASSSKLNGTSPTNGNGRNNLNQTVNPAFRAAVNACEQQSLRNSQTYQDSSKLPDFCTPKLVVLRATAPGPNSSEFTVWSFSPGIAVPPWCYVTVMTQARIGYGLGWTCQLRGTRDIAYTDLAEECCEGTFWGTRNYWANSGEVPPGVERVVFRIPQHGTVEVPVKNGWFLVVTTYLFPRMPDTYLNAAGRVIGHGVYSPAEGTYS
jgi:hypothetical protein